MLKGLRVDEYHIYIGRYSCLLKISENQSVFNTVCLTELVKFCNNNGKTKSK